MGELGFKVFHQAFVAGAIMASVCLVSEGAIAQSSAARADAFSAMLADPGNPDAMVRYARVSVADGDYEAAASTLERLLDIEPANSTARFELAVIYYTLGSYEIAEFHFRILQERGAGGPEVTDYLQRIARENSGQSFIGRAAFGAAMTDQGDTGLALSFNGDWRVDLGGANDTAWHTDILAGVYEGGDALDSGRVLVRTGPEFAVGGLAFGARLRPYAELEASWDGDDDDDVTYALGLQYQNAHSASWASFADVSFGTRDGGTGVSDAQVWSALAGVSLTPIENTRMRLTFQASDRDSDTAIESRRRVGARASVDYGGRGLFGDPARRWFVSAYAQVDRLDFDTTPQVDILRSFGVSMRTFVTDDAFVELSANSVERDSNDDILDETTPVFSLQFGLEF